MTSRPPINYVGLGSFLANRLNRVLTDEERGFVPTYDDLSEENLVEARMLAEKSSVFAIAYLQYILSPELAYYASEFVYEALKRK